MPENNQIPVNPNPIFDERPMAADEGVVGQVRRALEENLHDLILAKEKKDKEKKISYEDRLKKSIPKGWRLINRGELLFYPCMAMNNNYEPEQGWKKVNVLGVDKLNRPYNNLWGYYIIPDKKNK